MKAVKLKLVPAHKCGSNSFMSAAYRAKCPYCNYKLCLWTSEVEKLEGPKHESNNVCLHFDRLTVDGRAWMRPNMNVIRYGNFVRVNGFTLNMSMTNLINELERLAEGIESQGWVMMPAWCPNRRFKAIYDEAWRVYKAYPDKWKAQHLAFVEMKERAELARLKRMYETLS